MSDNTPSLRAWVVCLTAALFFLFAFLQVNIFNSISSYLLTDFKISAAQLGQLSSYYFIANVVLLFPAGILLDRFSPYKLILFAMLMVIIGTILFAYTHLFGIATIGRFLVGIGGTFSFLGCMKIATRWFPSNRLAFITGVIVTMAMIGGMVAQTPLVWLTDHVGWRNALYLDSGLGVVFFILIALIVRDYPPELKERMIAEERACCQQKLLHSIGKAITNPQNWLGGAITSLLNLPIYLLGAMWGTMYLVQTASIGRTEASIISSMLFVGMIVGSPLFGAFSDRLGKRRPPIYLGTFLLIVLLLVLMYIPGLNFWEYIVIFFLLGFASSAQVIGYPLVAESNPHALAGTGLGIASVLILAGGFTQPLFGWLMGLGWQHTIVNEVPVYPLANYRLAMLIMPIAAVLALFATLLSKETFCGKTPK